MESRTQAFLIGARRGLKFGAIVGIMIWLIVGVVCAWLMFLMPDGREQMAQEMRDHGMASVVGGLVATIMLMAIYGAIPGALIMGLARMMRRKESQTAQSSSA
jgi:hypothetical protein